MIKHKPHGYWYYYWDTYNIKASKNRKAQWWFKNIPLDLLNQSFSKN